MINYSVLSSYKKILSEMYHVTDRAAISDASSEEQVGSVCVLKPEILFGSVCAWMDL